MLAGVEFDDAYANLLLPKLLTEARMDSRDAGFAQELAFGTLRWQLLYDEAIEIAARRALDDIDPSALLVLRLGAHQLLAMRVPSHAALAETVELAKQVLPSRLTGFVNAVLRRVSERSRDDWMQAVLAGLDDENDRLAISQSHPVWVVRALRQALKLDGREAELAALLAADNAAPEVNLVALPGLGAEADLEASTTVIKGSVSPIGFRLTGGDPANVSAVREGSARVQDEGSQLVALALSRANEARRGENWLDLCAGPGGKAAVLAAEAQAARVSLQCNEVTPHRATLVKKALAPITSSEVTVSNLDGRDIGRAHPGAFDRIMVDAPCTGLGALRRRPEARWRKSPRDLDELVALQRELLDSAVEALAPNGTLAYVTCSPHPSETTAQIDWLLKRHPELELLDAKPILRSLNNELELNDERKTVQLWPHVHGTDAMFLAMFTKSSKSTKNKQGN